jgi:hypothetical protein
MKYIIINYDKTSTCYFHITHIFDELVGKYQDMYSFLSLGELVENSKSKEQLEKYFFDRYQNIPKYIISFDGFKTFFLSYKIISAVTKLVFIVDDIHHAKSVKKYRIPVINSSEIILATYAYQFEKWGLPKPKNLHFFPHSARWICDFNKNPIKKILISGRISEIYVDRLFAYDYAKENTNYFDILNCNFSYRDSNIDNNKDIICGKKFYDYLNKYLCCFVDTTRDYILAKTFEICASSSLLLCMDTNVSNIMEEIGFKNKINYISCTPNNFINMVNFILTDSNLDQINMIRYKGYELVKNNHTWENRMNYLKNILDL